MDVENGYFEKRLETLEKAKQDALKVNQTFKAKRSEFIDTLKNEIDQMAMSIDAEKLQYHILNLKNIISEMRRVSKCMDSVNSLKNQLSQSIISYRDEGK